MNRFILCAMWFGLGLSIGLAYGVMAMAEQAQAFQTFNSEDRSKTYYLGETFTFEKAVDGDTLDVKDARARTSRIRLHGIDTPERGQFYFAQATAELQALCKGHPIRLNHIGDGKFNRISANVYCGDTFVNAALLASGAAITAIKYADDKSFYTHQNAARAKCKGVWSHAIDNIYPRHRLEGRSPIYGKVKLTRHNKCLQIAKLK